MIRFDNVSKKYANDHEALKNINFQLEKGEMAFLTGHSGAGKSTILKLIGLIESCSSGQIFLDGHNINQFTQRKIPYVRRCMGMIFQNPRLLYDKSIFENVALPLVIMGADSREISKRVRAALDKVSLLSKEKYHPTDLSMGEQQRVGIARAIVHKPMLLLADEPTGNLDPILSAEIMNLFTQFNQVGVSVLIASHDLALIAMLKYRLLTLKEGSLVNKSV